jgi:hypothetical protein
MWRGEKPKGFNTKNTEGTENTENSGKREKTRIDIKIRKKIS